MPIANGFTPKVILEQNTLLTFQTRTFCWNDKLLWIVGVSHDFTSRMFL